MNRTHLEQAIRTLAAELGYTLLVDSDDRIPQTLASLPAAWLMPLRLKSIEGRRHGRQTYSVELRLLFPALNEEAAQRAERRALAEEQLVDLFTRLSRDSQVVTVQNLTIQPGAGSYTQHGELSQTAKADVVTCF